MSALTFRKRTISAGKPINWRRLYAIEHNWQSGKFSCFTLGAEPNPPSRNPFLSISRNCIVAGSDQSLRIWSTACQVQLAEICSGRSIACLSVCKLSQRLAVGYCDGSFSVYSAGQDVVELAFADVLSVDPSDGTKELLHIRIVEDMILLLRKSSKLEVWKLAYSSSKEGELCSKFHLVRRHMLDGQGASLYPSVLSLQKLKRTRQYSGSVWRAALAFACGPAQSVSVGLQTFVFSDDMLLSSQYTRNEFFFRRRLRTSGSSVNAVALHLASGTVITGHSDNAIRLWRVSDGGPVSSHWPTAVLYGHTASITCLDADESKLVSGSADRTLRVWDVDTEQCLSVLKEHAAAVRQLALDESGIVSCDAEGTCKFWSFSDPVPVI